MFSIIVVHNILHMYNILHSDDKMNDKMQLQIHMESLYHFAMVHGKDLENICHS